MNIKKVSSVEILDSRGFPTLATHVELDNGMIGWSAVPSGASTGKHEKYELRDGDMKRYAGKGVLMAKHNVEVILNDAIVGMNVFDQSALDRKMIEVDGTVNKSKLGANAILSISLAAARAAALTKEQELYEYLMEFFGTKVVTLPAPMINVINGGKHAEDSTDLQEYLIIPYGFSKFGESLRAAVEVFHVMKARLHKLGMSTTVGDEGGYAPKFNSNSEPLQFLVDSITEAGYVPGQEFGLGIDSAASSFYHDNIYDLQREHKKFTRDELISYYLDLKKKYPLCSFEDVCAEDDWEGFVDFTKKVGEKTQVIGDDLYVTNVERLKKGITMGATNAILIKDNQIGTLTETIETMQMAKEAGIKTIVSHRSGETGDPFIADLAVASSAGQIKTGSISRTEHLAKYNRLLEIESREKELRPEQLKFYEFPYKTNGF